MATITSSSNIKRYLSRLAEQVRGDPYVEVGFLEGATYPDGTSVALVAAINEFGNPSRGQPPRPFFRTMIQQNKENWPGAVAGLMRDNNNNVPRALDLAGMGIEGQLRQSIANLSDPPLKPSTIARKGSSKPLVDTGHMLNSIDHKVSSG